MLAKPPSADPLRRLPTPVVSKYTCAAIGGFFSSPFRRFPARAPHVCSSQFGRFVSPALVVFAQHGVPIQLELVLHVILKAGNLELGRVSG
jgi:hypothetical protein